jgi:hypothetical protein
LKLKDAAAYLSMSTKKLRTLIQNGELMVIKTGDNTCLHCCCASSRPSPHQFHLLELWPSFQPSYRRVLHGFVFPSFKEKRENLVDRRLVWGGAAGYGLRAALKRLASAIVFLW